jgi:circadian clock protein KaiC
VTVLPLTSIGLSYPAPTERMSLGIERLDHMLGGGVYRGSTVLVSGSPGTGKTSLGAHMADAACTRGERVLFMSFEESPDQLLRNMRSIGLDLRRWVDDGLLRLLTVRPTMQGLEEHLVQLQETLDDFDPSVAVLDAVGALSNVGSSTSVASAVVRQIDMIKDRGVTAMMTALTHDNPGESSALAVSSLVDTWLLLRNVEHNGERNRLLFVMKNRGSAHSNQVREFLLTDFGAELLDVYVGPQGVLTGSARMAQLAEEGATVDAWRGQMERRRHAVARRGAQVEREIAGLRDELAAEVAEVEQLAGEYATSAAGLEADRAVMATHRWADTKAAQSETSPT